MLFSALITTTSRAAESGYNNRNERTPRNSIPYERVKHKRGRLGRERNAHDDNANTFRTTPVRFTGGNKERQQKAASGGASTTIKTSSDKLFLFSTVEIDGTTSSGYASEGEQYEYWKTVKDGTVAADRVKKLSNGGGSANTWWLRSPHVSSSSYFWYINSTGIVSIGSASSTDGVSFGFCV